MPARDGREDVDGCLEMTRTIWALMGLGVLVRLVRYALDFPLWSDEAFVAANFLNKGYLELLRPLDYGQICPVLFLWAERASVGVLGFSEWSLRLFPLICGVASLGLFRVAAGKVARGAPLMLAVGVFAVSAPTIRYASEVKPYASDLLAALLLVTPALGWLQDRERAWRLWALTPLAPLAMAMSHPAVFVAGGVGIGLAWAVFKTGRRRAIAAFLIFNVATAASFLVLYLMIMRPQDAAMPERLRGYWVDAFPPLGDPLALGRWLVQTHTGRMLGYPGGGARGGSTGTLLLMTGGAWVLWRERRRSALGLLLAPFGLTMVAAAVHKYPYGGEARHMQYVAPAACLLAGIGAGALIGAIRRPRVRLLAARVVVAGLFVGGAASIAQFVNRPYIGPYDVKARDFARRFWVDQARDAEVACLMGDFGVYERQWFNLYSAFYLCNRAIYSPRTGKTRRWEAVSEAHPLRCVLYQGTPPEHPEVAAWLKTMTTTGGYELRRTEKLDLEMREPGTRSNLEHIVIFEFVPKRGKAIAALQPPGFLRR